MWQNNNTGWNQTFDCSWEARDVTGLNGTNETRFCCWKGNSSSQCNETSTMECFFGHVIHNPLPKDLRKLQLIIVALITFFTILGNSLVLIATWRERTLREPNKYFIAYLAFSDLLDSILVSPLWLYQIGKTEDHEIF